MRRIAASAGIKWAPTGAAASDDLQFQLVEAVGRDRFVQLMLPALTPESPPSPNFHRLCKLMGMANFAAIISTNWDMLLDESGCCERVAYLGQDDNIIDDRLFQESQMHHCNTLCRQKPLLIKIQGDISTPSMLNVSRDDYARMFAIKSRFLDRLTRRYSIFSIGRSCAQLGQNFAAPAADIPRMRQFFVCNDLSDEDKLKLAEQGVTALSYCSRETEWQGNRLYLENLVAYCQGVQQS